MSAGDPVGDHADALGGTAEHAEEFDGRRTARAHAGGRTRPRQGAGGLRHREVGTSLPAGRVGDVKDIASGYLSLMTQPYATGTILTLDGGTLVA